MFIMVNVYIPPPYFSRTEQEDRIRFSIQKNGFPAYISSEPSISADSFSIVSFFSSFAVYWAWMARKR